jgi:uncharacterized protein YggL (DUF469 family)
MSHHRSRRLRKKLHIDEFQELGFEVAFRLRDGLSADEMGAFWDAFIGDAIEGNGLLYGGWPVCESADRPTSSIARRSDPGSRGGRR